MLYPVPAVLVVSSDGKGNTDVMTAAWTGNLCSDPVMVSVSVRPERYTHDLIAESGEFVLCLTTRSLCRATDFCGVRSGRDIDKFKAMGLTKEPSRCIRTPGIGESPVNLECVVREQKNLGSHDVFIAEVVSVDVDDRYLDDKGRLDLARADLMAYSHGEYYALGEKIGKFGFSVEKNRK
ncbi:MAG: flavin reductase family protein [Lachnospiraceae bacterium]|jgi:flavin reductase (DIM6/NTAB) family NADH-FMN oxidoreductase RutF|nr:flavin reductase family protein [Lachnospiraceae bacterium]